MEQFKKCSQCGLSLPLARFNKRQASRDGLESSCKNCKRFTLAKWRLKNRDRAAAYTREWKTQNAAKYKAHRADFYLKNTARLKAQHRGWLQSNREQQLAYGKLYRDNNRNTLRQRWRTYESKNREQRIARFRDAVSSISDSYVARIVSLAVKAPVQASRLSPAFIAAKRQHLAVQRTIKEKQHGQSKSSTENENPRRHQARHEPALRRGE